MSNVLIYTSPACVYCKMTKDFFKKHDVKYEEIDVRANPDRVQDLIDKSGQLGVPVTDVDGTVVVGYDPETLSDVLKLK